MADRRVLQTVSRMLDLMETNRFVASGFQPTGPQTTNTEITNTEITNASMLRFTEWFYAFQVHDSRFDYTLSSTTEPNTFALEYERNQGMTPFIQTCYHITVQANGELCINNELNNVELARGTAAIQRYLITQRICKQ